MKKKFFTSFILIFVLFNSLVFSNENLVIDISVKTENISEKDSVWLVPVVADKIEVNLNKYLKDVTLLNSVNLKDIFNIQSKSSSFAFEEEIEIGKLKNANHQLFITVTKIPGSYTITARFTDLKTREVKATVSKSRRNINDLYSSNGCAIDEITIDLCSLLGSPLTKTEKSYLMNGDLELSYEEKTSIYKSEEELYNKRIAELDKEIKAASVSSDIKSGIEEDKLRAERVLAEEKLKIAQDNQKRIIEEEKRKKEAEALYEERSDELKQRITSMADKVNKKVSSVRNIKYDNESVLGQINVIELKKKAISEIYDTLAMEKENIIKKSEKDIENKKSEIYNKKYRSMELDEYGNPSKFALEKRDRDFEKAKNIILSNKESSLKQLEDKLNLQIIALLADVQINIENLKTKTVSTLTNELSVSYGNFNTKRLGWDLFVTVRSDDTIILQTKAFLSFEDLTGKNPQNYMETDYDNFLNDIDFYDSLFLRNEPLFVFDLTYSAKPDVVEHMSEYVFSFSKLTCYDTSSLVVNGNSISSKKEIVVPLETSVIHRKMLPSYDLTKFEKYNNDVYKFIQNARIQDAVNGKETISKEIEYIDDDISKAEQEEEQKISSEKEKIANSKIELLYEVVDKAVYLPKGTDGSAGPEGEYILFGIWPQTNKDYDIDLDKSQKYNINNWECYKGDDGLYYTYFGSYYRLLEPIKWRVCTDNYQGGSLLVAEKSLKYLNFYEDKSTRKINKTSIYPSNYEYSTVRAYLNGLDGSSYNVGNFTDSSFIKSAFSAKGIELINTVNVDNSIESTGYTNEKDAEKVKKYICNDTKDKIFLLSDSEIKKFSCDVSGWLRSPDYSKKNTVKGANYKHEAQDKEGVVPALSISNIHFVKECDTLKKLSEYENEFENIVNTIKAEGNKKKEALKKEKATLNQKLSELKDFINGQEISSNLDLSNVIACIDSKTNELVLKWMNNSGNYSSQNIVISGIGYNDIVIENESNMWSEYKTSIKPDIDYRINMKVVNTDNKRRSTNVLISFTYSNGSAKNAAKGGVVIKGIDTNK